MAQRLNPDTACLGISISLDGKVAMAWRDHDNVQRFKNRHVNNERVNVPFVAWGQSNRTYHIAASRWPDNRKANPIATALLQPTCFTNRPITGTVYIFLRSDTDENGTPMTSAVVKDWFSHVRMLNKWADAQHMITSKRLADAQHRITSKRLADNDANNEAEQGTSTKRTKVVE